MDTVVKPTLTSTEVKTRLEIVSVNSSVEAKKKGFEKGLLLRSSSLTSADMVASLLVGSVVAEPTVNTSLISMALRRMELGVGKLVNSLLNSTNVAKIDT